ncbi:ABC transporter permease [Anatilimnocola floriformis]|uniref:ABC transporter permease n=1 Tax=Anatilimnocola floriformis TaxID=2948575 RepID=UPI0020C5516B|nr:ABC transporter permease [Anatilimnocola floriformis]
MFRLRLLPWEYGVRNLLRRPARSALTLGALATVVFLVFVVVAFIRGLESSLAVTGQPNVVLVYSINTAEDIENSAIPGRTAALLSASLAAIEKQHGVARVSPELYVGTRVARSENDPPLFGIVRGVSPSAPLVRRQVQLTEGHWPGAGEVIVGKLVAAKLGCNDADLQIGKSIRFDGHDWKIAGRFAAGGAAFESEIWVPLADFQAALKRQDLSLVAIALNDSAAPGDVELFCKERYDLELQAVGEMKYYAALQKHYQPVRMLGWLVVLLVAGAGVFAGLNTMYGSVMGRVRELATLQAVGYRRRAIVISLMQEAVLLSTTASLLAAVVAIFVVNGTAVRFTMGAFALRVDSVAMLVGCGVGLLLGVFGAIPPAWKAMQHSVVDGLKAV